VRLVRDDVVGGAGVEAAHRDHDRIEHVEPPGDQRLQRGDHLARRRDRILGQVRLGRVAAPPADRHVQDVGGAIIEPGRVANTPGGERADAACGA
jgi:hypothetical protein